MLSFGAGAYMGGLLPELRNKTSQKKKYAAEVMSLAAVSQLASLPLEIRFSQQDCGLQRLRPPRLQAPRLGLEQSPAELSRSFARTPRGVQHWPEHRCIFS